MGVMCCLRLPGGGGEVVVTARAAATGAEAQPADDLVVLWLGQALDPLQINGVRPYFI